MVHRTTVPAPVHQVRPGAPLASMDQGDGRERPRVEVEGLRASVRRRVDGTVVEGVLQELLMPLYRLINDPFRALQERRYVKPEVKMADFLLGNAVAA